MGNGPHILISTVYHCISLNVLSSMTLTTSTNSTEAGVPNTKPGFCASKQASLWLAVTQQEKWNDPCNRRWVTIPWDVMSYKHYKYTSFIVVQFGAFKTWPGISPGYPPQSLGLPTRWHASKAACLTGNQWVINHRGLINAYHLSTYLVWLMGYQS